MVTTQQPQESELIFTFDSFGDDSLAEVVRQSNDGHDQRCVIRIGGRISYKRSIQLHRIDGQALEITERRVTGTEIVDGDSRANVAQAGKRANGGFTIFDKRILGNFY